MRSFLHNAPRYFRAATHLIGTLLIDREHYCIKTRSRFAEALEHLTTRPNFFFIQVGANDGVRFDDLYQKVTVGYPHGLVIEPLPRYFLRLKANYEDYPGVIPLNIALHPTKDSVILYHADPASIISTAAPPWSSGIGSINPNHYRRSDVPTEIMTHTRVQAATFNEVLKNHRVSNVDVLQVDTEGFDLEILKMFPFENLSPRLIKYEHASLSPHDRVEAETMLINNGYKLFHEAEDTVAIRRESLCLCGGRAP